MMSASCNATASSITSTSTSSPGTNSAAWEAEASYTGVRVLVSATSFSVLLLFNLLISSTIVRVEQLRSHARFVLLFHLLFSALLYLATSTVFHYQVHVRARPGRAACAVMVTLLMSSGSHILLTLTAMALDRYWAVCHPMRYTLSRLTASHWPWALGALTWLAALAIPLAVLGGGGGSGGEAEPGWDAQECGREQLRRGQLPKVVFIGVCTALILYSYVRILLESHRLGVLNRRNRAGCRTIALHFSQLAVFLLPNFVSFVLTVLYRHGVVSGKAKEHCAVVIFAFFSLAQCVAPVVYGLRKEELVEQLEHRFPCCSRYVKNVLGWTVHANRTLTHQQTRERTLTAQTIISLETTPAPEEEMLPVTSSSYESHSC